MPFTDLTPLPPAPARTMTNDEFIDKADAFVAALVAFVTEFNTFQTELEAAAALIAAAPEYSDPGLVAMAGLTPAADRLVYFTGASTSALATLTSVARTLLAQATQGAMRETGLGLSANGSSLVSAADYAAMRALLDLEAGTDFLSPAGIAAAYQPLDGELSALAGLASAADKGIQFTGAGTAATFDLTAFAKTMLDDVDAAAVRATIAAGQAPAVTFGANTISLTMLTDTGDTLLIQGGSGTLGANATTTVSFPTAYSTAPVCIVSGGSSDTGTEGDVHSSAVATTTGIAIANSSDSATGTYTWLAVGKA